MAFTYTYDLASKPLDRVRFETGDTDAEAYFLEDEEINALLTLHSTDYQKATLAGIRAIIGKLARPDFRADWLQVSNKTAIDAYRRLLSDKEMEYGVNLAGAYSIESSSVDVVRSDIEDVT